MERYNKKLKDAARGRPSGKQKKEPKVESTGILACWSYWQNGSPRWLNVDLPMDLDSSQHVQGTPFIPPKPRLQWADDYVSRPSMVLVFYGSWMACELGGGGAGDRAKGDLQRLPVESSLVGGGDRGGGRTGGRRDGIRRYGRAAVRIGGS